jgi:RHS repeat-associated protein
MREGESCYYYHNDHLGTPQKLTAQNGLVVWQAKYAAFGEAMIDSASTITNNLRLSGQYYDEETQLHYNYHRYYDPRSGRYLTPDPIGLQGGINVYSYVKNNPINLGDPLGLFCKCSDSCPSGSYKFKGVEYGGFLFFAGVTAKKLIFTCMGGKDTFSLTIQSFNFGGGLGGGVQFPVGVASGCNMQDVMDNISGWGVFLNIFPPGIPQKPGFGVGGDVGTNPVTGNAPYPLTSTGLAPGYGLEVSAGGSYSWIVK